MLRSATASNAELREERQHRLHLQLELKQSVRPEPVKWKNRRRKITRRRLSTQGLRLFKG